MSEQNPIIKNVVEILKNDAHVLGVHGKSRCTMECGYYYYCDSIKLGFPVVELKKHECKARELIEIIRLLETETQKPDDKEFNYTIICTHRISSGLAGSLAALGVKFKFLKGSKIGIFWVSDQDRAIANRVLGLYKKFESRKIIGRENPRYVSQLIAYADALEKNI